MLRAWFAGGYYIVTYTLGIYILNLLIAFLSPQDDPEVAEELGEGGPVLPISASDEFRPFVRRLPEFKFWFDPIRRNPLPSFLQSSSNCGIPLFLLEAGVYGGFRELGACGKVDGEGKFVESHLVEVHGVCALVWLIEARDMDEGPMMNVVFDTGDGDLVVLAFNAVGD
uniref:Uncharacterized protein n=1 Tax=Oryza barthii TaxID=65489 RepID=A0A0D3FT46_9ORYZ